MKTPRLNLPALMTALAATLSGSAALAAGDAALPPLVTVDRVDLTRYAGRWFEVAKIPNRFQKQCHCEAAADYTLRDDGRVDVVNSCRKADGTPDQARGLAKVVDKSTNARLKVSFVSFLGWRPFWGDYWIIGLDADYGWAVIGTPSRKYGWVLSRTPALEASTMDTVYAILERNGYRRAAFEISPH